MLKGFDASSVQGRLPWPMLHQAGYQFVLLKAQQGNDGLDPTFLRNVENAKSIGIAPLAYCFAYPLEHIDPEHQAQLFSDAAQEAALGNTPLFIDCEWPEKPAWARWGCTANQIATYLERLFAAVEALGKRPGLYTYPYWWSEVPANALDWAAKYPLWIADYRLQAPTPEKSPFVPKPWNTWTFWQWNGNGGQRMPNGVDADFDVFNGDGDAFQAFLKGTK